MYEPYPHKISNVKIVFLLLLFLLLFLGFYCLKTQTETLARLSGQILFIKNFQYFLLAALIIFSLKTFTFQYSREYLYLFLGTASFFIFEMLFIFYFKATTKADALFKNELCFEQIGGFIFYSSLFFAAFNKGQVFQAANRKKNILTTIAIALFFNILFFLLLKYFILSFSTITKYKLQTLDVIAVISAVVLLISGIKFIRSYFKTRHNIYFWYIVSLLFFFFSNIYFLPNQLISDRWADASVLLQFVGFAGLIWIHFLENTHFMDSEIELRSGLEKSLFKSEQSLKDFKKIFDGVEAEICVLDRNGKIIFFNEKFVNLLAYSDKQLKNCSDEDIFNKINFERYQLELEKLRSGNSSPVELEMHNRYGKNIPVLISAAPIFNKFGLFDGCRLVIFEITEKKDTERELKDYSENLEQTIKEKVSDLQIKTEELNRAKKYYETLIAGMLDILLVVDRKGNCTFINDYGKNLLGYKARQLTSKRLPNFFADLERLRKNYGDAMKVELRDYEASLKTKIGKTILCNWNVRYLFDPDGKNIGAMCVGRDISEYKVMQKKLEEHSKDLEKLVSQRTQELKVQVNQISKILKIGEELALNIEPRMFLSNICKAIKNIGWQIVVFTVKDDLTNKFKITAYEGIDKTRIRKFVYDRDFLYKDVFKYVRDEFKVSKSYLVHRSIKKPARYSEPKNGENWQSNDVLIIPVKIKTKILGFIFLFNPKNKTTPEKQQIFMLETFAHKAAVSIENRRLFEEAETRAKELSRVNKSKTNFFTTMSHELRTPLNSIISLTDVLVEGIAGTLNSDQLKQVQIIRRNGKELLKLINNLLDFSKIEAGKMELNYTYFSIVKLIQDNLDTVRPLCQRKKIKLELKLAKNLPKYIFCDQDKIQRTLSNILANAVKFTHSGKIKVDAKFEKQPGQINFFVTDTGIGMTKGEIENIFKSFKQVNNIDTRKYEGSGLGLSITKRLLDLMGGTISVESKKGKGTTFQFSIPVKDFGNEEKKLVENTEPAQNREIQKVIRKRKDKHNPVILLVDDNKDNQYAVKFILKEQGYKVIFASNGKQGIKKAQKEKPDLILMDMMMPGIDGYQATKEIREHEDMKKTPIIAMTAKTIQEDKKRAIEAGCNEYLNKPFSLDAILGKVNKWLGDING